MVCIFYIQYLGRYGIWYLVCMVKYRRYDTIKNTLKMIIGFWQDNYVKKLLCIHNT